MWRWEDPALVRSWDPPGGGVRAWHFRGEYDKATATVTIHKGVSWRAVEAEEASGVPWKLFVVVPSAELFTCNRPLDGYGWRIHGHWLVAGDPVQNARILVDRAMRERLTRSWVGVPSLGGGMVAATRGVGKGMWVEISDYAPLEPHEVVVALDAMETAARADTYDRRRAGQVIAGIGACAEATWTVWCSRPLTIVSGDRSCTVTLTTAPELHRPSDPYMAWAFNPLPETGEERQRPADDN